MGEFDFDVNTEDIKKGAQDPYADLQGEFPRDEYINVASTNLAARGLRENELTIGGSTVDMNLDIVDMPPSEYPYNQVRETITGHVTEVDDTPGRERLLFKHRTGAGIDMRPDGTVIINSKHNTIEITGNDQKVIVKGDGDIHYHGNLKLHVDGDFDMVVGGNYNLDVKGDKREHIRGNYQLGVVENFETTVVENKSSFVNGIVTDTYLSDNNVITKGNMTTRVEKDYNLFVDDDTIITSKDELSISTKNANIAATDMVVQSTTGMIGGDNVFHYGKNYYGTSATFTEGVTAPTFHGSLEGNAKTATQAGRAGTAGALGASGSAGAHTNTATNTSVRTSFPAPGPDATWLNDYLQKSGYGYRSVAIDVGNVIRDEINKTVSYAGVSTTRLTTREVRSKLRDPSTARNSEFIGRCQAEGILSATVIQQKPEGFEIGRIENTDGSPKRVIGEEFPGTDITQKITFTNNQIKTKILTPSQQYNPELNLVTQGVIDAKTPLAKGVKLGTFLGAHGDPTTINHITDETERVRIAKNLYLHANFMSSVQQHLDRKNRNSIIVAEGFSNPKTNVAVDSINDLMTKGRAVVYELRDRNGLIPLKATFDLAVHIKDYMDFEKMILDYDTYDPSGALNAQIIMIMPEVTPLWEVVFDNKIETRYNNVVQTNGELVELL